MHSEPPAAANKPKRAPRIRRRQLDALFADLPRERRRRFFDKAYQILEKSAEEILDGPDVYGDAVPKFREDRGLTLMKMAAEIAGIAERADKREEPYRKIILGLTQEERPTVQILIGQRATSPAMRMLVGAEKQVVEAGEPSEESAAAADELPTPDRER